jgi:hypothetical protein
MMSFIISSRDSLHAVRRGRILLTAFCTPPNSAACSLAEYF